MLFSRASVEAVSVAATWFEELTKYKNNENSSI
jgi:hypothetical protein